MDEEFVVGYVVGGSIEKGVKVKIVFHSSEDVEVGGIYIAEGLKRRYLLIANDVVHESEELASQLARIRGVHSYLDALRGSALTSSFRAIVVAQASEGEVGIARALPDYLSRVRVAGKGDVEMFYGVVEEVGDVRLGLGMPTGTREGSVSPNLNELVATSFAIYGKSGTGKTVLGNMLAMLIALKTLDSELDGSSFPPTYLLILDMHSEYGTFVRDAAGNKLEDGFANVINKHVDRKSVV